MLPTRYQKSRCKKEGYLHKWKTVMQTKTGWLERCERCGEKKNFPLHMPNAEYLSYHIRSVLRANDPMFHKEYPQIKI